MQDPSTQPSRPPTSRLGTIAFGTLVLATIAAFFITQAIKVETPLINGDPMPFPAGIDPLYAHTCWAAGPHNTRVRVSYRAARFSFYLQHRPDYVDVSVISQRGKIVRTVAKRRYMRTYSRYPDGTFSWNGREDDGALAPDGVYYFRIKLLQQDQTFTPNKPLEVLTVRPHPVVTSVTPAVIGRGGNMDVTIAYTGTDAYGGTVTIYRLRHGDAQPVERFATKRHHTNAVWDGKIGRRPAPVGVYLIGLDVTNQVCTTGQFPSSLKRPALTAPQAIVDVR